MQLQIIRQVITNALAQKVWHIVAHQFDTIGQWASAISHSQALTDTPAPNEAPVAGRICSTSIPGFSSVRETFIYYDEPAMRFAYAASTEKPSFIARAENHWTVRPINAEQTLVEARAELALRLFPGLFLLPLLRFQLKRATATVFEELKYYIEHNQPHPRKLQTQRTIAEKLSTH
ncbi:MAG: SRPBCC family protein [Chloroflexales bacterium]|nr:SRPBCC family protein [Chloroflexales bacterium]